MKKKVKEEYLVDALSYTECEARIIEEMKPFISGEFSVDIKRFRIAELFAMDGDRFYKVTADYITMDEKSGNEKRKAFNYIVRANDLDHAKKNFEEGMKGTISDFVVTCIKEEKKLMDSMSLTVRSGTQRSMRIVSNKASYETMSSVAEKLMEISKMEGTIYRILTLSNKTYLASKLGYSRSGFYKKIQNRNFNIRELAQIFDTIINFKDQDWAESKIDRLKRYRAISLMEFNKNYKRKKA